MPLARKPVPVDEGKDVFEGALALSLEQPLEGCPRGRPGSVRA